ncbi:unnamed protein product [Moneuplotes crassus]|uniref:Uncharacterized protein n=1 Tax=Euplotes crassus TaxID=5936 RepID=A0AAD1USX6_EUPCR|nr:unnamed protein product [Moneuplotes crassus]
MNLKDSPAQPLPSETRSQVSKFKVIRLNGGTQYIGRLNKSLSVKEIASTISALENPSILPTSDVVMLPIRESQITPKDQFMKHFYNNTRNLKKLNRSVPKKIPQSKLEAESSEESSINSFDKSSPCDLRRKVEKNFLKLFAKRGSKQSQYPKFRFITPIILEKPKHLKEPRESKLAKKAVLAKKKFDRSDKMICKKIKLLKKRTVKGRFDQINKTSQSKILKLKSSSHNVQKIIHNLKHKIDSLTSKTDEHNILLLRSKNLLDEYQIHVQKIIQNTNKSQVLFDGKKGGLGDDLFDEHRNDNKENLKKELITLLMVRELTSKYLDKAIKLHESDLEEYKKDSKMNTSKINLSNNLIQHFIDRFKVTERQFLGILHKAKAMVTL